MQGLFSKRMSYAILLLISVFFFKPIAFLSANNPSAVVVDTDYEAWLNILNVFPVDGNISSDGTYPPAAWGLCHWWIHPTPKINTSFNGSIWSKLNCSYNDNVDGTVQIISGTDVSSFTIDPNMTANVTVHDVAPEAAISGVNMNNAPIHFHSYVSTGYNDSRSPYHTQVKNSPTNTWHAIQ